MIFVKLHEDMYLLPSSPNRLPQNYLVKFDCPDLESDPPPPKKKPDHYLRKKKTLGQFLS